MNNSISGVGSSNIGMNSFYNKKAPGGPLFASNKKIEKKKVLPVTKKFPELKLMINGEQRNHSNSLSSDDENINVSRVAQAAARNGPLGESDGRRPTAQSTNRAEVN